MSWRKPRVLAPAWGLSTAILAVMCAFSAPAAAQGKCKPGDAKCAKANAAPTGEPTADAKAKADDKAAKNAKPKTFDFTALDLNGRMRSPQLLYFLERANEELERASLEKRSFIPHMVRSMDEEAL